MSEEKKSLSQQILVSNREKGSITGLLDVISFNENEILLDTDLGMLKIRGKDLHVSRLSLESGELDLEGNFDSFVYTTKGKKKKNLWLFPDFLREEM